MNPTRMRIIQIMLVKGKVTTKLLADLCEDIPQATLYRNVNRLIQDGLVEVVGENKIRGVLYHRSNL